MSDIEIEVMEKIAEEVAECNYSGTFCLEVEEGIYVDVNWSLDVHAMFTE